MNRLNFLDNLWRDLVYAMRSLRRSPGFAALVVGIMALGIGANTAVFSVINAVLLKPLPYPNPDRIVTLATDWGDRGLDMVTIADFRDWQQQNSTFEAMATYRGGESPVTPGAQAEYAEAATVDADFFRVFGIRPVVGRAFTREEMEPGSGAVVISHAFWQTRFGGDAGVLQRTIRVGTNALPVVGVMPQGFRFPGETDLWVPQSSRSDSRTRRNFFAVGRLRPGVSLEQAQTEMRAIAARLEQQYPESNKGRSVALRRLHDQLVGKADRLPLYLLWGAVGVVLLIACANTATLLLGKATARVREVAVRLALGASRRRVVRQLITESLLLALAAGASGLLLAWWGAKALAALVPAGLPAESGIDGGVLAFTLGVTLATSLLFGLVPALHASNVDLNDALKQAETRSVLGGRIVRTRGILVVSEIALAVVLLSGAGLLVKSLIGLHTVELGFQPDNVLVMRATGMATFAENNAFFREALSRIAALPGVVSAGATMVPPGTWDTPLAVGSYFIDRKPEHRDRLRERQTVVNVVAPGAFRTLGIPLTRGRDFNESDTLDNPMGAIVNEALVREAFRGEDPIGRTIFCPFDRNDGMTIVGVVGDVRQLGPARSPSPICYLPYQQHSYNNRTLSIVVRTAGDPAALAAPLRRAAAEISPNVPVAFTTMAATVSQSLDVPRFRTLLFGAFAGLAVCLALAGVYGVMAYAVEQRSSEIGLRMALGASSASVVRLILRQGLVLAAAGLAFGLASALGTTRLLANILFEVKPLDPQVYLGVVMLLGGVTVIAGYVPARRASTIEPLSAIRNEPGSMWQAARLKVRQVVRELSATEPPLVPLGPLITDFAGSVRSSASFSEAVKMALAALRERVGAQSVLLLERVSTEEYRGEFCSIPAQGVLLNRLKHYPHPLSLTDADFEVWARWAREFRPDQTAEVEFLRTGSVRIAVPLRTRTDIVGVLLLGPPEGRESYSAADKEVLSSSAEVFALMIENARLNERALEQEKVRRDLALAAEVQKRLLPPHPPRNIDVALAAFTLPARTVGGDYFDFLDMGEEQVGIAVADIAGKGIAAALLMSAVQASLRVISSDRELTLSQLAATMNQFLYRSTAASKYATFFCARIEERGRQLRYVNAGHHPPYLLRSNAEGVSIAELTAGGAPLGLFPEVQYEEAAVELCPGDLLVAFTDGVPEALNVDGEEFGEERLQELLRRAVGSTAEEISSKLSAAIKDWIGAAEQHDDVTVVVAAVN